MFHSINPVNHQVLNSFPILNNDELDNKLSLSKSTFHSFWKKTDINYRIECILKVKDNLRDNTAEYAEIITKYDIDRVDKIFEERNNHFSFMLDYQDVFKARPEYFFNSVNWKGKKLPIWEIILNP